MLRRKLPGPTAADEIPMAWGEVCDRLEVLLVDPTSTWPDTAAASTSAFVDVTDAIIQRLGIRTRASEVNDPASAEPACAVEPAVVDPLKNAFSESDSGSSEAADLSFKVWMDMGPDLVAGAEDESSELAASGPIDDAISDDAADDASVARAVAALFSLYDAALSALVDDVLTAPDHDVGPEVLDDDIAEGASQELAADSFGFGAAEDTPESLAATKGSGGAAPGFGGLTPAESPSKRTAVQKLCGDQVGDREEEYNSPQATSTASDMCFRNIVGSIPEAAADGNPRNLSQRGKRLQVPHAG